MAQPEMRSSDSYSHRLNTYGFGLGPEAEVILEIERRSGPSVTDVLLTLTLDQARALSDNLLQSIKGTEPRAETDAPKTIHYPVPPADLALHLYGLPYGEEFM